MAGFSWVNEYWMWHATLYLSPSCRTNLPLSLSSIDNFSWGRVYSFKLCWYLQNNELNCTYFFIEVYWTNLISCSLACLSSKSILSEASSSARARLSLSSERHSVISVQVLCFFQRLVLIHLLGRLHYLNVAAKNL